SGSRAADICADVRSSYPAPLELTDDVIRDDTDRQSNNDQRIELCRVEIDRSPVDQIAEAGVHQQQLAGQNTDDRIAEAETQPGKDRLCRRRQLDLEEDFRLAVAERMREPHVIGLDV